MRAAGKGSSRRARSAKRAKEMGALSKRRNLQMSSVRRSFSASTSTRTRGSHAAAWAGASAKKRTSAKGSPTSCRQPLIVPGMAAICWSSLSGRASLQIGLERHRGQPAVALALGQPSNPHHLGSQGRHDHLCVDDRAGREHPVGVDEEAPKVRNDFVDEEDGDLA